MGAAILAVGGRIVLTSDSAAAAIGADFVDGAAEVNGFDVARHLRPARVTQTRQRRRAVANVAYHRGDHAGGNGSSWW